VASSDYNRSEWQAGTYTGGGDLFPPDDVGAKRSQNWRQRRNGAPTQNYLRKKMGLAKMQNGWKSHLYDFANLFGTLQIPSNTKLKMHKPWRCSKPGVRVSKP
jgi:hypothetical protein